MWVENRRKIISFPSFATSFIIIWSSTLFQPVCTEDKGSPCLKTTAGLTLGSKWTCHRWGWGVLSATGGKIPLSPLQHQQLPHHRRWPAKKKVSNKGAELRQNESDTLPTESHAKQLAWHAPPRYSPGANFKHSACREGHGAQSGKSDNHINFNFLCFSC